MWSSVWSEVQIVCLWSISCQRITKPHYLLPHLNPDWFYLSGTGLTRLSWKKGRWTGVVVVVVKDAAKVMCGVKKSCVLAGGTERTGSAWETWPRKCSQNARGSAAHTPSCRRRRDQILDDCSARPCVPQARRCTVPCTAGAEEAAGRQRFTGRAVCRHCHRTWTRLRQQSLSFGNRSPKVSLRLDLSVAGISSVWRGQTAEL